MTISKKMHFYETIQKNKEKMDDYTNRSLMVGQTA